MHLTSRSPAVFSRIMTPWSPVASSFSFIPIGGESVSVIAQLVDALKFGQDVQVLRVRVDGIRLERVDVLISDRAGGNAVFQVIGRDVFAFVHSEEVYRSMIVSVRAS